VHCCPNGSKTGLILKRYAALITLLILSTILSSCASSGDENSLHKIVKPYSFNILTWEVQALTDKLNQRLRHENGIDITESTVVTHYFELVAEEYSVRHVIEAINNGTITADTTVYYNKLEELTRQRLSLEKQAEGILEKQISQSLIDLDIYNPLDNYWNVAGIFPPVILRLQEPPRLLVVSPRDKIERLTTIILNQEINSEEMETLEDDIAQLDLSALVVDLGGIATYPSFVNNKYGLRFAVNTAIEEWLHQYLFFRPLGVRYALAELGIRQPYEIIIMNETLASMVSQVIGERLYQDYYAPYDIPNEEDNEESNMTFDFNNEMREIRKSVDILLEEGKIDEAEAVMEDKRLLLASHGYFIRKLNQAYFAFYGSYADTPGFTNPIYDELTILRDKSSSLSEFFNLASSLSSREELNASIN
jgi:hypothetical protein